MAYAILQKELIPPAVEQLKRAFSIWPALTDLDAQTVAHDAHGILLRGLELAPASALQDALLQEQIDTVVAEESELPVIPPAKLVRQMELLPAQLTLHDPMARTFTLAWADILFIAAGSVRWHEFKRRTGTAADLGSAGRAREESHHHLLLDIVLVGGAGRYSVTADEFVFQHPGARLAGSLPDHFRMLVRDLAQSAPHAGLNRGAWQACQDGAEPWFVYPSKAAFYEEVTWMLWRIAQINRADGI